MSPANTKTVLLDACIAVIAQEGVSALSVRRVAREAGVNPALVSYHFDGMSGLVRQAYARATAQLIEKYHSGLESVRTVEELYGVGVRIAASAREDGSAAVLAQALAAAFHDRQHAEAIGESLRLWNFAVREAVWRVFLEHNLDDAVDVDAVSRALAASMIGMLTVDSLEPRPLGQTLSTLAPFARLVDRTIRFMPSAIARHILNA